MSVFTDCQPAISRPRRDGSRGAPRQPAPPSVEYWSGHVLTEEPHQPGGPARSGARQAFAYLSGALAIPANCPEEGRHGPSDSTVACRTRPAAVDLQTEKGSYWSPALVITTDVLTAPGRISLLPA